MSKWKNLAWWKKVLLILAAIPVFFIVLGAILSITESPEARLEREARAEQQRLEREEQRRQEEDLAAQEQARMDEQVVEVLEDELIEWIDEGINVQNMISIPSTWLYDIHTGVGHGLIIGEGSNGNLYFNLDYDSQWFDFYLSLSTQSEEFLFDDGNLGYFLFAPDTSMWFNGTNSLTLQHRGNYNVLEENSDLIRRVAGTLTRNSPIVISMSFPEFQNEYFDFNNRIISDNLSRIIDNWRILAQSSGDMASIYYSYLSAAYYAHTFPIQGLNYFHRFAQAESPFWEEPWMLSMNILLIARENPFLSLGDIMNLIDVASYYFGDESGFQGFIHVFLFEGWEDYFPRYYD